MSEVTEEMLLAAESATGSYDYTDTYWRELFTAAYLAMRAQEPAQAGTVAVDQGGAYISWGDLQVLCGMVRCTVEQDETAWMVFDRVESNLNTPEARHALIAPSSEPSSGDTE